MEIGNIKFKAKRLDNGEWVEGDLAHSLDGGLNIFGFTKENGIYCYSGVHLIDPKTVCQFTGLKDCEGNEVWNHDLLQSPCREEGAIYEVSWGKEDGGFIVKESVSGGRLLSYLCPVLTQFKFKVIGNKFDKEK